MTPSRITYILVSGRSLSIKFIIIYKQQTARSDFFVQYNFLTTVTTSLQLMIYVLQ